MKIKKYVLGFVLLSVVAYVLPKPEEDKKVGVSIEERLGPNPEVTQAEDKQSFDEYATNVIRHFVETGSDTPSPWYDTETLEDPAFSHEPSGDSPWEIVD